MSSQLEILSQVMLSLTAKQSKIMHNINVLLSNRENELDLVDKIEHEIGELSSIHAKMHECESFMLQLAKSKLKPVEKESIDLENKIGSSGDIDVDKNHSEK